MARQYCGRLGKVENCQTGVFAGFAGPRGHGLLDARLYMPEEWFAETEEFAERRKKTGVPTDLVFKTKPGIAAEMIGALHREGRFPARWIGCDSAYGSNRDFLNALPPDLCYFASVKSNTRVLLEPLRPGLAAQYWLIRSTTNSDHSLRSKLPRKLLNRGKVF